MYISSLIYTLLPVFRVAFHIIKYDLLLLFIFQGSSFSALSGSCAFSSEIYIALLMLGIGVTNLTD